MLYLCSVQIKTNSISSSMQEHMFHVKVHSGSFDNVFSCSSIDIANFIHENPGSLDLDLQGIWISDRMFRSFCTAVPGLDPLQLRCHGTLYRNRSLLSILCINTKMSSPSSQCLFSLRLVRRVYLPSLVKL